ncbi:putative holin-like toxin [Caldifermentibacillus hisashii]|uniref:putative holin-like toxin n=1 Tax=Caldifermentibacillus hisashii TaxID=996558 RepID=UPI003D1564E4
MHNEKSKINDIQLHSRVGSGRDLSLNGGGVLKTSFEGRWPLVVTYEALNLMLAFGMFVLTFLSVLVAIFSNKKK